MKTYGIRSRLRPFLLLILLLAVMPVWSTGTAPAGMERPPLDLILVLDNSGSMKRNDPGFRVRKVIRAFFADWHDRARLGIVVFDGRARLVLPLSDLDAEAVGKRLPGLLQSVDYRGRRTDIALGVERAFYELKVHAREGARQAIVLLTDGHMDTGDPRQDRDRKRWLEGVLVKDARGRGVRIYGIAFTEGADYPLLQTLAEGTGGDYFRALDAEVLQEVSGRLQETLIRAVAPEPSPAPPERPADAPPAPAAPQPLLSQAPPEGAPLLLGFRPNTLVLSVVALGVVGLIVGLAITWGRAKQAAPPAGDSEPADDSEGRAQPASTDSEDVIPEITLVYEGKAAAVAKMAGKPEDLDLPDPFDPGRAFCLRRRQIGIGRDSQGVDVVIPDQAKVISRRHARILYRDGEFYLEDVGSTNGTYLIEGLVDRNGTWMRVGQDELGAEVARQLDSGRQHPLGADTLFSIYIYRFRFVREGEPRAQNANADPEDETRLASSAARGTGEDSTPDPVQEPKAEGGGRAGEGTIGSGETDDGKTQVAPTTCANHPSRKAEHLCVRCHRLFCDECVTIEDGKPICRDCGEEKS